MAVEAARQWSYFLLVHMCSPGNNSSQQVQPRGISDSLNIEGWFLFFFLYDLIEHHISCPGLLVLLVYVGGELM